MVWEVSYAVEWLHDSVLWGLPLSFGGFKQCALLLFYDVRYGSNSIWCCNVSYSFWVVLLNWRLYYLYPVLSMAKSQNPAILATTWHCLLGLWWKILLYRLKLTIVESPNLATISAMALLWSIFDNTACTCFGLIINTIFCLYLKTLTATNK